MSRAVSDRNRDVRRLSDREAPERGFTLLELTIAMALMIVALALANELLVESQRRLAIGARALLEPDDTLALRQLRDDLRAAAPVAGRGDGPLDCRRPELIARWELVDDRLERHTYDVSGDRGARPMLDQVVAFRWRPVAPGAVEVEIVRRRAMKGGALRAGSARWHQIAETLEETRIVAASRLWNP